VMAASYSLSRMVAQRAEREGGGTIGMKGAAA
jgi:hypothetical protein